MEVHIAGPAPEVPDAARIIYADGSAPPDFRPDVDLELSHWVPNRTRDRWVADTSTEIALRFAADPPIARYDRVVNNHADVDGILTLFALVHSPIALRHAAMLRGAAEMGDFSAGVDRASFTLAQEIIACIGRSNAAGRSTRDTYLDAFDLIERILSEQHGETEIVRRGWARLEYGGEQLATTVRVECVHDRFVSFTAPTLREPDVERALRVPGFNSIVDDSVWMWPHTRNREHGERVQLVSVPAPGGGFFHDLWLPGYAWARTPNRWAVPGLVSTGDSNEWTVALPELGDGIAALQRAERNPGRWRTAARLTPFTSIEGRGFPVVASFVDGSGRPAVSSAHPDAVSTAVAPAFRPDA